MKLKTVKLAKETGLEGVEFITTDKQVTEIVIGKVRIKASDSYSKNLIVMIEEPYEEIERYRLTATLEGFDPSVSYFDDDWSAQTASVPLENKGAVIAIDKVKALIDDDGNVVSAEVA